MKRILIKPLAVAALFTAGLFGCATSDSTMDGDTTAMDDNMTMSETQTMAGNTTDEGVYAEADTDANMPMTAETDMAEIDYGAMFEDMDTEQYDLVSLAKMDPNLTTFVMLVEQAGLADELKNADNYTVFAPTNAAFSQMPQADMDMLMKPENKAMLIKTLQAHVLPNEVSTSRFNSSQRIETGGGEYVLIDVEENNTAITIGGAMIVKGDVEASNGVLHVVDNVVQTTDNVSRY